MSINEADIRYAQYSLTDGVGRVFEYNNKIYRGINTDYIEHIEHLLNCGLIAELIDKNLFPNTIKTDLKLIEYSLVLEHEKLFYSCSYEWTYDMLRDAALVTLKINEIALKYGFQIKDAHPYNILFKNNQAFFIDLGSFTSKENTDFLPANQFLECFCLLLALHANGKSYLAHKFQLDIHYPKSRILIDNLPFGFKKYYAQFQVLSISLFNYKINISQNRFTIIPVKILNKIIRKLNFETLKSSFILSNNTAEKLRKLTFSQTSTWSNYQNKNFENNTIKTTDRFDVILNFCRKLETIESALDVAANQGLFPVLLNQQLGLKKIIHLDYDVNACNPAYLYYKTHQLPIDIICTNFIEISLNNELRKRLKSDIVFGLALSHHLLLSQYIPIKLLFSVFSDLTNKYVAIEFMPLGLWDGKDAPPLPDWYNLDWFRAHFKLYFNIIFEQKIEENRIIFIGEKLFNE
jgi:hypothetical protein